MKATAHHPHVTVNGFHNMDDDALEAGEYKKPSSVHIVTDPNHLSTTATAYAASSDVVRIITTIVVCIAWTMVSSVAILVNKHVMVDVGFKFPTTVAFLGLITTTALSYITLQVLVPRDRRQAISLRYYLTRIMPTGFMMALTFQTGNGAYLYLTVAFVQMLKAFCPVITMLLLFAVKLERATPRLVASVAVISLGVAMASYGEMNMSMLGLTMMLTSVVAESVRLVMTQHLLVGQSLHPFEGLVYIGSACSLWLFVLVLVFEWSRIVSTGAYTLALAHPGTFLSAALAGFGVNCLAILVIQMASSLTLKVLGTVKDAALVTVGVLFLHEAVSPLQLSGYVLSLTGFVSYNVIKATSSRHYTAAAKAQYGVQCCELRAECTNTTRRHSRLNNPCSTAVPPECREPRHPTAAAKAQ